MTGKIIKGVAGDYTVISETGVKYICRAKGIFRKNGITPLIGDNVEIEILSPEEGNILKILERKNSLIRPACANIDQVLVVFAAASPEPNLNLLDRFLIMMEKQSVKAVLCFNKTDIVKDERLKLLAENYAASGMRVLFASVLKGEGIEEIREVLRGKTTILAGPSGVGKSSLMNRLFPEGRFEVGALSERIGRGKQTTRHTELVETEKDTYLCDSPGFSSIYIEGIDYRNLKDYFPEFENLKSECRFLTCNHIDEPDCAVKEAVKNGLLSRNRYESYCILFNEMKKTNGFKK
ncbi:MAG: ribosome small subunit-dependent GTPase A [Lachnospiraceae bacterium]|nr:ribosome small subunit-dependent GTPase A [Lachnospiraceae bacterium]